MSRMRAINGYPRKENAEINMIGQPGRIKQSYQNDHQNHGDRPRASYAYFMQLRFRWWYKLG